MPNKLTKTNLTEVLRRLNNWQQTATANQLMWQTEGNKEYEAYNDGKAYAYQTAINLIKEELQ